MKKQVRAVLLTAAALAAVVSAQAATYPGGDLIIGFTSSSGADFEYDLGQASSLTSGQTFDLHSQLSGFNLSTVNWGVVGTATIGTSRFSWATVSGAPIASAAAWSKVNTAISTMYALFPTAGPGSSATPDSADPSGWNQESRVGGGASQYHNVYVNPNTVGTTSADFFSVIAAGATSQLGSFSLGGNGILTFTAVPEPSTYVMAGMGLLALYLRRQFAKANV